MSTMTTRAPVRGSGAMRTPLYLIGIASCVVLAGLFASRENWLGLVLVLGAAVAYAIRLVVATRADNTARAAAARGPVARTTAEQTALKAELGEMRAAYDRNRKLMLVLAVAIAGPAVVAWSWNPAFALALALFSIPFLALAWRSSRAIRTIDGRLSSAR